jgi:hypothetical protein
MSKAKSGGKESALIRGIMTFHIHNFLLCNRDGNLKHSERYDINKVIKSREYYMMRDLMRCTLIKSY